MLFKFEEVNGNHKFVIDAKDYFDLVIWVMGYTIEITL